MNALEKAIIAAAERGGAPAKVWNVDPDAAVEFGEGHPFDGATFTAWELPDVIAARNE